jgi:hypothetical protein
VKRGRWAAGALALAGVLGCGIGVGRDLSRLPPQEVIYDDLCKVQDYFDAIAVGQDRPPAVGSASEVQKGNDNASGGITTFAFETEAQLRTIRRVLNENWEKLPPKLMTTAPRIDLQVKWAEKAGVRRVVTTEDAQITYEGITSFLPYHICLSELLFGAPLYKTRRDLLGLPPLVIPPDAAVADATPGDGGGDAGAPLDAAAAH